MWHKAVGTATCFLHGLLVWEGFAQSDPLLQPSDARCSGHGRGRRLVEAGKHSVEMESGRRSEHSGGSPQTVQPYRRDEGREWRKTDIGHVVDGRHGVGRCRDETERFHGLSGRQHAFGGSSAGRDDHHGVQHGQFPDGFHAERWRKDRPQDF